jgi:hypothetical protein
MSDSNPAATFGYVVTKLDQLGIAYLHVVEPRIKGIEEIAKGQAPIAAQHLRQKFGRTLIAAGGFTGECSGRCCGRRRGSVASVVTYPNPTCPNGSAHLPLIRYDRSISRRRRRGYIDYPRHTAMAAAVWFGTIAGAPDDGAPRVGSRPGHDKVAGDPSQEMPFGPWSTQNCGWGMIIIGANEPVAVFSVRLCFFPSILKCIDPQREGRRRLDNRVMPRNGRHASERTRKLAFGYEWSHSTRSNGPASHGLR